MFICLSQTEKPQPLCVRWRQRGAGQCVLPGQIRSHCWAAGPKLQHTVPLCCSPPRAAESASFCRERLRRRCALATLPQHPDRVRTGSVRNRKGYMLKQNTWRYFQVGCVNPPKKKAWLFWEGFQNRNSTGKVKEQKGLCWFENASPKHKNVVNPNFEYYSKKYWLCHFTL